MYEDTYLNYRKSVEKDFFEREMHKVEEKTLARLSPYFAHPSMSVKDFMLTIAYGYFESFESAITLAEQLDLGKVEFLAVMEEFEAFKEAYIKEFESAQNF